MTIVNFVLSVFAFIISLISFFISVRKYNLSIPKLKFDIADDFSRYIGFYWYDAYNLAIIKMYISNPSAQSVDINSIVLTYLGQTYLADTCSLHDRYNKNGISVLSKENTEYVAQLNISSENILNNKRIEAYGTSIGFAVFYDFPEITSDVPCTLKLTLPNGKFTEKDIVIHPLDDNEAPIHPLHNQN